MIKVFAIPCILFLVSAMLLRKWDGLTKAILVNFLILITYGLMYLPQTGLAPVKFLAVLYWHSLIVFVVALVKKVRERTLFHRNPKTDVATAEEV